MNDVPIKFTLTADEQRVLAAFRAVDAGTATVVRGAGDAGKALDAMGTALNSAGERGARSMATTAANVKSIAAESRNAQQILATIGREAASVRFHGSASRTQVRDQIARLGNEPKSFASLRYAADRDESARVRRVGFSADQQARRQAILSDPSGSLAANAVDATARYLDRDGDRAAAQRRRIVNFARTNKLDDVTDPVNFDIARRQLLTSRRASRESLRAIRSFDSPQELQAATAAGVDLIKPSAVREFRAATKAKIEEAVRAAKLSDEFIAAAQRIAKTPRVTAAARFEGVNVDDPAAMQAFRSGTLTNRARRRLDAQRADRFADSAARWAAETSPPDFGEMAEAPIATTIRPRMSREDRMAKMQLDETLDTLPGSFARQQAETSGADYADRVQRRALDARATREDASLVRSNRSAQVDELRQRRRSAIVGKIWGGVSTAAGIADTAALAGNRFEESLQADDVEHADAAIGMERTLRPLIGMGDGVDRQPQIRRQVLATAAGSGIDYREAESFEYQAASDASGFDPATQRQLKNAAVNLTDTMGGTSTDNLRAIIKLKNSFNESPDAIASKVQKTVTLGALDMGQFSERIADIAPAMKLQGYGLDETLAAVATGSRLAGRWRTGATALRDIPLMMHKAIDAGLATPGKTLIETLAEIKAKRPDAETLEKNFGVENTPMMQSFMDALPEQASDLASIRATQPGDLSRIAQKYASDPVTSVARQGERIDAVAAVVKAGGGYDAMTKQAQAPAGVRQKAIDVGYEYAMSRNSKALTSMTGLAPLSKYMNEGAFTDVGAGLTYLAASDSKGDRGKYVEAMKLRIASGQYQIADSNEAGGALSYNAAGKRLDSGHFWATTESQINAYTYRKTDQRDVDAWEAARKSSGWEGMQFKDFQNAQNLRETGKGGQADAYLADARRRAEAAAVLVATAAAKPTPATLAAPGVGPLGFSPALLAAATAAKADPEFVRQRQGGKSVGEARDASNTRQIKTALELLAEELKKALDEHEPFKADAVRTQIRDIQDDRRAAAMQPGGETATNRGAILAKLRDAHPVLASEVDLAVAAPTTRPSTRPATMPVTAPAGGRADPLTPTGASAAPTSAAGRSPAAWWPGAGEGKPRPIATPLQKIDSDIAESMKRLKLGKHFSGDAHFYNPEADEVHSSFPDGTDGSKGDRRNETIIEGAQTIALKGLVSATARHDQGGADAAKRRLEGIRLRRDELANDADGYTPADRATLATEIKGLNAGRGGDGKLGIASDKLAAATEKNTEATNRLAAILAQLVAGNGTPGTKPTNAPSGPPRGPRTPVGGGARPTTMPFSG